MRMVRRSIAWSSGIGMAKVSNGTIAPAASRLSSSVKCNDEFVRKVKDGKNYTCEWVFVQLVACFQDDPRESVWRWSSVCFGGLSKWEREIKRGREKERRGRKRETEKLQMWHVRLDWKLRAISRSLQLSRSRIRHLRVRETTYGSVSSFRITRRQTERQINPQCRTIKTICSSFVQERF